MENNKVCVSSPTNVLKDQQDIATNASTKEVQMNKTQSFEHIRRTGAMAVTGQLYETKLLTLFLLQFQNRKPTPEFYLGANLAGAGALDDLCFKYKPAHSDRHVVVFLQAKHKVNPDKGKMTMADLRSTSGDFSVENHFESYLMIRQKFTPKSRDIIFKGAFHDSRCLFVIYTPLKHSIEYRRLLEQNDTNDEIRDLLETNQSGDIFQLEYKHFDFLTEQLVDRNMKQLGKTFFDYIVKKNAGNMMEDKLIKMYHVVLWQNVVEVIDDTVNLNSITYKFRKEFYDNKERSTNIFRESLYAEAVNYKPLHAGVDDVSIVESFLNANLTAESISYVIGTVVNYDRTTNKLVLAEGTCDKTTGIDFLNYVKVTPSIIRNAVNIKGKRLLKDLKFILPDGFGNRDLTLKGSASKMVKRLNFLATNLIELLQKAKCSGGINIVELNDSLVGPGRMVEHGVVEHDGGLGSALGNLLVLDGDTGTLKFNTSAPLPEHAKKLWNILTQKYDEHLLTTYRFKFWVECFPKYSFQDNFYEEYLVKDFIGHYWLCTGQAKEDAVEDITKKEINRLLKTKIGRKSLLRAKSDAVFLKLHDSVQKWWMLPEKADYLTMDTTYLRDSMNEVIDDLLLTILNHVTINKLRSSEIEFDEVAVKSLSIDEATNRLVLIVTDSVTHTAIKLMQHYASSQSCTFIDFNYVTSSFFSDLVLEINNSNLDAFVLTCTASDDIESICDLLVQLIEDVPQKKITVITDVPLSIALKQELAFAYYEVKDNKNGLMDLCTRSREMILSGYKVLYQGDEVVLKSIIAEGSQHIVTSHILQKLINGEVIEIGKPLASPRYYNMRKLYIKRYLTRREAIPPTENYDSINYVDDFSDDEMFSAKNYIAETLNDLSQDIVVITAPPGMGKSTFLTHLSLETKTHYPNVWIARINLLDYTQQFHKWQQGNITIDAAETLKFLCNAVTNGNCEHDFVNTSNGAKIKADSISVTDILQAELFIHLHNNGLTIFIFDGFDEICPLYEKEVISLMKATASSVSMEHASGVIKKPKLWIASRSYNNVKHVIEREFGLSYTLAPLSAIDQRFYLDKYWKQHMKLEQFTFEQFQNVTAFMEYMKHFSVQHEYEQPRRRLKPIHVPLHEVFIIAAKYFQDEINNIALSPAIETLTNSWRQDPSYSLIDQLFGQVTRREYTRYADVTSGSPLHTNIVGEYLQNEIQFNLANTNSSKWDLDTNTFSLYKRFLEMKVTKIRFEEKNCIDVSKPDSKVIHDRELAEFVHRHRMLAYHALFRDASGDIMSKDELDVVKATIEVIRYASEKTGVIDCIVGDVPRFVHLTFAEYFAADYICEALKSAYASQEMDTVNETWEFILTQVIMLQRLGVSGFVDYKLFDDVTLRTNINDEHSMRMVFECLMEQARYMQIDTHYYKDTAIDCAVSSRLKATSMYLLKCFEKYLESNDSEVFTTLVASNDLLWTALQNDHDEFVDFVLNIFRNHFPSNLHRVMKGDRFSFSLFTKFSKVPNAVIIRIMNKALAIKRIDKDSEIHVTVSDDGYVTFRYVRYLIDSPPRIRCDSPVLWT